MAKKSIIERNKKRVKLYIKYKSKRINLYNLIKKAQYLDDFQKYTREMQRLPKNSTKIRIRNRCWKTGRGNGYYRYFGLCRHQLRQMALEGLLPGVTKSSW